MRAKGRWPKSEAKRKKKRAELERATRLKRQIESFYFGKIGAASPVRHLYNREKDGHGTS